MRKVFFLSCLVVTMCVQLPEALARKKHKFKGVIIVNQILKLDGKITRNGEDAPEFSGVKEGDLLETGDKSTAVIRIPGLAIFKMSPNTQLKLKQIHNRDQSRFEIPKGNVISLFRRPGEHEIKISHGQLKLNSGIFYVMSRPAESSDALCLCDGKIHISTVAPKKVAMELESGYQGDTSMQNVVSYLSPDRHLAAAAVAQSAPISKADLVAAPGPGTNQPAKPLPPAANPPPGLTPTPTTPASASPAPGPTPTASPGALPTDLALTVPPPHQQCEISAGGIEVKNEKLLEFHSEKEIQDLESLYDLP